MRLRAVLRIRPAPFVSTRPLIPVFKSFSTMSDQLTNSDSPPAKRSRTDAGPSTLQDPVIPVAATKAMFAPQRTKAEEKRRKRKEKHPLPTPYSNEDIMWHDVRDFLGPEYVDGLIAENAEAAWKAPEGLEHGKEITIRAGAFTVSDPNGKRWAVITPFAHPGDLIRCKIYKHHRMHSNADMVEILEYDELARGGEGDRRKFPDQGCKYFGVCGGCQFHPMPYHLQLAHKKRTVKLAYERFSKLPAELVPEIQDTIPSPKQWGYRTKITPHFDAAPNRIKKAIQSKKSLGLAQASEESDLNSDLKNGTDGKWWMPDDEKREINWNLRIGFDKKAGSGVLDIEDCPIAAPIINRKMAEERKRVQDTILTYPRAATLLLRDSLPAPTPSALSPFDPSTPFIAEDEHVVVTNHKEAVYERVGDKLFTFTAGAFFQNNNSILVPLTSYVKDAVFPAGISDELKPTHLVDTYCGSGLFGITLSEHFEKVAGVEIDPLSVAAAKKNAEINNLGDKTRWLCGKAEDIFGGLPAQGFSGEKSCVVIDPPRKGCDELFLEQLIKFRPLTIVYVSCNVHTQARDVGWFMATATERGIKYELESLRGFDLFPQTAHVESVAVLRLSA